jgi:predicted nucleic acid-binding protein
VIIADTDFLIDALRGREPARSLIEERAFQGVLATTAVSAFELLSGSATSSQQEKVGRLLAAMAVLPFEERAAQLAAETRRALEAAGTPIGMADYQIAGICLARGASLLSRNRRHFERVPGLDLLPLPEA